MSEMRDVHGRHGPVVALDGPGSSGKSSVGAAAAARLGLRFCDTGLLYRAVTYAAQRRAIEPAATDRLVALVGDVRLEPDDVGRFARVTLEGADVTEAVHDGEVDAAVSSYARVPELRAALLARQRSIADDGGIVMAGRDIGTVVLPDADIKIYIDASLEERARRRTSERGAVPDGPEAREILAQLRARDRQDASRPVAPLRPAVDAIVIRTDGNAFETTVDLVVAAIRERTRAGAGSGAADTADAADAVSATGPVAEAAAAAVGGSGSVSPRAAQRPARRPSPAQARRPIAPTPIATRIGIVIRVGSFVMRVLARVFTRIEIEGDLGAIPRTGTVLIAVNHASNADPVLVGGFLNPRLGRPINWMGKREVFEWPVISWLARHGGVHPVERGAADVEAFRTAMRILEGGNILAVFPEGTRSPDGRLQAAKDGVAVLAARSGALIVPIGIGNSDRLWPKGRFLPKRTPSVTIRIGEPFTLAEAAHAATGGAASRRKASAAATELIMRRIAALLPIRQRGAYGDPPAD